LHQQRPVSSRCLNDKIACLSTFLHYKPSYELYDCSALGLRRSWSALSLKVRLLWWDNLFDLNLYASIKGSNSLHIATMLLGLMVNCKVWSSTSRGTTCTTRSWAWASP
jgi:hypothetical protein